MKAAAALAVLVSVSGPAALAGAQTPTPQATFDVQPRTVTAGSDVTVSGTCPAGSSGTVQAFANDATAPGDQFPTSIQGALTIPSAESFSEPFTIPAEVPDGTWRFSLLCAGPAGYPSPPEVEVTTAGAHPVPVTAAVPGPAVPGQPYTVTGTGCLVAGRAFERVGVGLHTVHGTEAPSVTALSTPSPDGSYSVTLQVPRGFPPTKGALLSVDCSDISTVGVHFTRGRGQSVPVTDINPSPTTTAPRQLPRTGAMPSTPWLLLTATALVAAGLALLTASRRRHSSFG